MSVEKFEVILNDSRETWLNDHQIHGKSIFPAAGYIELVLANLDYWDCLEDHSAGIQFDNIKFFSPLTFTPGKDKAIETEISRVSDKVQFKVMTKGPNGNRDFHVEGNIKKILKANPVKMDIKKTISRCSNRLNQEVFYSLYRQVGVKYGPFFQSTHALYWNETEILAELFLQKMAVDSFLFHPAYLDGAFQAVGIFSFFNEKKEFYLPFYIGQILIYNSIPNPCFCYGRLLPKARKGSEALKFDILFCDQLGNVQVEIKTFCLKSISNNNTIEKKGSSIKKKYRKEDVAIIGMAGKFPSAPNLDKFWENLAKGIPCVSRVPKERWDNDLLYDENPEVPGKTNCRYGCFLSDIDQFDPMFFGISVNKAKFIDPQQRLMLETVYHTIEDAGYGNNLLSKTNTGVYIGVSHNEYIHRGERRFNQVLPAVASGNAPWAIANRISYLLDLRGPSIAMDTACSSSAVALFYAVQDIIYQECKYALVGGINLTLLPSVHIIFSKLGLITPHGLCRPLDKQASGYLRGEGVGAVLLKSLDQAIADRDNIYAIIKGISVNHTGNTNGFNSPSSTSETSVILEAFRRANVNPETISYVEAHGSGTPLGDQLEFRGLVEAFRKSTSKKGYCALGSIKSNIGHLEPAAGIASVIKTVLALKRRKIPPLLNFITPNDKIKFNQSPFFINDKIRDWENGSSPRRAGVSCFGFGGTNVHLILEEFPTPAEKSGRYKHSPLLTLSAKSFTVVEKMIKQIIEALNKSPDSHLNNICGTLNSGRNHHQKFRLAVLGSTSKEMVKKLTEYQRSNKILEGLFVSKKNQKKTKIAFLFGSTCSTLNKNSFKNDPLYMDSYLEWEKKVNQICDIDSPIIKSLLYGLSLSHVLNIYGIRPHLVGGVGAENITAAIVSNYLSFTDAVKLIVKKESKVNFNTPTIPFLTGDEGGFYVHPTNHHNPSTIPIRQQYSLPSAISWLENNDYSIIVDLSKIRSLNDLNQVVAEVYVKGININWKEYYKGDQFNRVSFPTYPFKRTRYWLE